MSRPRREPREAIAVHEHTPVPGAMSLADFVLLQPGDIIVNVDGEIGELFGPIGSYGVIVDTFANIDRCAFVRVKRFDDPQSTDETFYAGRFAVVGRVTHEAGKLYYDVLRVLDE